MHKDKEVFENAVKHLLNTPPKPHKAESETEPDQSDSENEASRDRKKRRKATRELLVLAERLGVGDDFAPFITDRVH